MDHGNDASRGPQQMLALEPQIVTYVKCNLDIFEVGGGCADG